MATAAIAPSHLLESRMFSQVLNLYVANTVTHFVSSTLSLFCADRLCDSCVGLQRRLNGECAVFQDSRDRCWDPLFLRCEATLATELSARSGTRESLVCVKKSHSAFFGGAVERYQKEILDPLQAECALILFVNEVTAHTRLQFVLLRDRGARAFEGLELERVETLRRYVENAWGLLNERLATRALIDGISVALRNYHRGTLMVNSSLRVIWHNRAARECLELWRGTGRSSMKPSRSIGRLPEDILCACQNLHDLVISSAVKSGFNKTQLVRNAADPQLRATVKLCPADCGGMDTTNILVQFEKPSPQGAAGGNSFVDSLTSGEREVAGLVRTGMSNQEIADRLGKTVVAIKFHLHRIFKKAEVKNRTRLMLKLSDR